MQVFFLIFMVALIFFIKTEKKMRKNLLFCIQKTDKI